MNPSIKKILKCYRLTKSKNYGKQINIYQYLYSYHLRSNVKKRIQKLKPIHVLFGSHYCCMQLLIKGFLWKSEINIVNHGGECCATTTTTIRRDHQKDRITKIHSEYFCFCFISHCVFVVSTIPPNSIECKP